MTPLSVPASNESGTDEYLNRELSWLEFNRRVLNEALDSRTPLLERVAFLAIFNSNLDEYFQKRVGGLKRQIVAGISLRTPDGLTPRETLAAVRKVVLEMLDVQARCFTEEIRPALKEAGVELLSFNQLTGDDIAFVRKYFRETLFPLLTPLAVDPGHPFPFISNLSMSLGVMIHPGQADTTGELAAQFARVKVPRMLPRWVRIGSTGDTGPYRFIHMSEVMRHNLSDLFEGMVLQQIEPFRLTRNADIERDEEDAEDLLELIEQELRDRRFGQVVRLEVARDASPSIVSFLMNELELEDSDIYQMSAEMDYTDLGVIADLNIPHLKNTPWTPTIPPRLADKEADMFSIIRAGDVLVHHPYDSFGASVERFIRDAARDPKVVAIKQTLYRTSADSPFIPDLIRAAEAGKQVVCLVELKARFDEERNIQVAQLLEKAGVHVVYGMVGLKTHTKTAVVVRHELEGMRVYAHIGTGNYNSKTAQIYTDLGLFTCNPLITSDLTELFHSLTGRSIKNDFGTLLIAPINMRRRFMELIDREITHAQAWRERGSDPQDPSRPRIVAKMNSLEDRTIVRKLYDASQAGVRIDLIVRGFCCLRPGVPGLSENITVMSVIGRFLEHSRIFHFHNNGQGEYYIGSADWMYRNLNNRVECITPILDPSLQAKLRQILAVMFNDQRQAWDMAGDGRYTQRKPAEMDASQQAAAAAAESEIALTPGATLDPAAAEAANIAYARTHGTHATLMHMARRDAGRSREA